MTRKKMQRRGTSKQDQKRGHEGGEQDGETQEGGGKRW